MLIKTYKLETEVSTHTAQEFEYETVAHFDVDISEVLPYLNAVLKNGAYFEDGPAFSWRIENHKIGFWPKRIAVDHLESREEAREMMEELVKIVNDTWERRGEITPDTTRKENLQPLELFRLLPKTNCKECGEASCFNFALKLAAGQVELAACRALFEEPHKEALEKILELLRTKRTLI